MLVAFCGSKVTRFPRDSSESSTLGKVSDTVIGIASFFNSNIFSSFNLLLLDHFLSVHDSDGNVFIASNNSLILHLNDRNFNLLGVLFFLHFCNWNLFNLCEFFAFIFSDGNLL